jgi:hypothetical protein
MSDAFERWLESDWEKQVRDRQPTECLGCLNQRRYGSKIMCLHLPYLLDRMQQAKGKVSCPYKVTDA